MKIIDFIRLIRRHLVLLILAPVLLASLVVFLTRNPNYKFASGTTLFTGIATGSSIEMDKSFNYFMANTAFDNLINIVKSRNTQEEAAIRLLSQHLLLEKPDPKYILAKNYDDLKRITPAYIYNYVVKDVPADSQDTRKTKADQDTLEQSNHNGTGLSAIQPEIPDYINQAAYEKTVENLTQLMRSSDTNFVYKLLNFPNAHYSLKDISTVKVSRINSSDMIQLKYEADDPGICQQTLALLTNACIRNYKIVKENRSDAVIKYFEDQLAQASDKLRIAEDKLLQFNKDNNIINYYEQSKAVAVVKEDLDVVYNNMRIKLAGIEAAIKRLEEKLNVQDQVQLKSSKLVELRKQLGDLNFRITTAETFQSAQSEDFKNLANLKAEAKQLEEQLKESISDLYRYSNTTDGLPVSTILNEWITNVIEAENIGAGIKVMGERIKEFQKQYAIYAPAGANIKRIEREISVSEQEFLEILHGLNLAKLKLQDNELAANIKVVDPPYYPLSPIPTKRKILVILAAMVGFILVLSSILFAEYFDETLKNQTKASRILQLPFVGVFPRVLLNTKKVNQLFIYNRLLEIIIQNIELTLKTENSPKKPYTILFFSTQSQEGKTTLMGNLARKLKIQGKSVLVLNYANGLGYTINETQAPDAGVPVASEGAKSVNKNRKLPIVSRILGYPDLRIDYNSSFLDKPQNYLDYSEYYSYQIDESFFAVKNCKDFLSQNKIEISTSPDILLIEIPPILYNSYPVEMIADADLPLLICRSNRVWSEADQNALNNILKSNKRKTHFILNGVDMQAVESIIGEVPRERSWFRKKFKAIIQLQFLTKSQI